MNIVMFSLGSDALNIVNIHFWHGMKQLKARCMQKRAVAIILIINARIHRIYQPRRLR